MPAPPPTLDGAQVLWWAWSDEPFGELPGAEGGDRWVHGFAICRYDSGALYRFTCNRHWEVVQDMDHTDEEEAKARIPTRYDVARVPWERYQDRRDPW